MLLDEAAIQPIQNVNATHMVPANMKVEVLEWHCNCTDGCEQMGSNH